MCRNLPLTFVDTAVIKPSRGFYKKSTCVLACVLIETSRYVLLLVDIQICLEQYLEHLDAPDLAAHVKHAFSLQAKQLICIDTKCEGLSCRSGDDAIEIHITCGETGHNTIQASESCVATLFLACQVLHAIHQIHLNCMKDAREHAHWITLQDRQQQRERRPEE